MHEGQPERPGARCQAGQAAFPTQQSVIRRSMVRTDMPPVTVPEPEHVNALTAVLALRSVT